MRWGVDKKLELFAIRTEIITQESGLVDSLMEAMDKQGLRIDSNDVLAIASKIVAIAQRRLVRLDSLKPSRAAKHLAQRLNLEPDFVEVVLQEADEVYDGLPKAMLTVKDNILTANAGVDQKNAPSGHVVLWPKSPYKTAEKIRKEILEKTRKRVGVIIVDSRITPLRMGTTGLALAVAGFEPVRDYTKDTDLFNRAITITRHAIADDLASAAHVLMGESNEQTPAVLIKDAPVKPSEKADPILTVISKDEDLFARLYRSRHEPRFDRRKLVSLT